SAGSAVLPARRDFALRIKAVVAELGVRVEPAFRPAFRAYFSHPERTLVHSGGDPRGRITLLPFLLYPMPPAPVTHLTDLAGHSSYRYESYFRLLTTERHSYMSS